ncbi:MAG TPA: PQQ-binding-like beta-propeller repeat protein [Steroidobacteraceae bacterium]|nr:PQQ-binding-like beta-propeller repeat protein [Steroidobacteraceae bacterium]
MQRIRWRMHVVLLHVTGQIPDIGLGETIGYMMPSSAQGLEDLIERRNPYAVIRNTETTERDIASGGVLFLERCSSCHGPDGRGSQIAPALVGREFEHGDSDWAVFRTIRDGVANTPMPATPYLSETQRWQVISFVRSLGAANDKATSAEKTASPFAAVAASYETIAAKAQPDADWLTYSGSYTGTRHSSLRGIDRSNVERLTMKWLHQFENSPPLEVTPLVRDGLMFISVPPCSVQALDAATGHAVWTWKCQRLNDLGGEFGNQNRGVALLDDKIFYASSDARMFALEAATGKQVWQATIEPEHTIYYVTAAPLAYRDVVVIGTSTRQIGRGAIVAFDVHTGKERWRFHTVPGPGERGHETWDGESWRKGGGPAWLTGSYDPELDLLYWGIGNPKPDYDAGVRKGDNLYTNSAVALRGTTGELVWHFQFVPADNKDWGANQIPVLVNYPGASGSEKRLLWANRNGYYYVFDREKGTYLLSKAFAQVTWTPGLTASGRPLPLQGDAGNEGRLLYPGNVGATHWSSPTYYAARDWLILPVLEQGMVYFPSFYSPPKASGRAFYTAVRALNARTGEVAWEHRHAPRLDGNFMPGLVSTAGGLVFGSDQSTFFALDIDNGELLWSTETGGTILGSPMTYEVNGEQYVSIPAGGDLLTFGQPHAPKSVPAAGVVTSR